MNPQQPDFSAFTGYPGYGGMFAQPQATFGAYFPGIQMPTAAASDAVTGHVKKVSLSFVLFLLLFKIDPNLTELETLFF